MMSKDLGGIQQAFIDYHDALSMQKHEVINITSIFAAVNDKIHAHHKLPNFSSWCLMARVYFWYLAQKHKPDLIICHGNRAISFASALRNKNIPIIGISHNYSYKHLRKCDYVLTLTQKLKSHLIKQNFAPEKLLDISNMTRVAQTFKPKPYQSPIRVGSFGRFVHKKGFHILLEAISLLKTEGKEIKLLLGGDGPEKENLAKLAQKLSLEQNVTFYGWVDNKKNFFDQIDLFCLPSLDEPFGIILLEAMDYSAPIIATRSGGPEEIIEDKVDGLLAEIDSSRDLAAKIKYAIEREEESWLRAKAAHAKLQNKYDIKIVSKKLSNILEQVKNEL
jgi:glycosyltransferase involved in cell wall biosynthesis